MRSKPSIRTVIAIATASIPIVSYGALLRERSLQFDKWLQAMIDDMQLADGAGLGVMLSTSWVFVMFTWIFGIAFFIVILVFGIKLSENRQIKSGLRLIMKMVMMAALAYPTIILAKGAIDDIRWQFHMLACGEFVTFIALSIGIFQIGAMKPQEIKE